MTFIMSLFLIPKNMTTKNNAVHQKQVGHSTAQKKSVEPQQLQGRCFWWRHQLSIQPRVSSCTCALQMLIDIYMLIELKKLVRNVFLQNVKMLNDTVPLSKLHTRVEGEASSVHLDISCTCIFHKNQEKIKRLKEFKSKLIMIIMIKEQKNNILPCKLCFCQDLNSQTWKYELIRVVLNKMCSLRCIWYNLYKPSITNQSSNF